MRIGSLAKATGVSCDTLRFYEKRGLIRAARGENGYRSYPPEAAQLVGYIRTAQRLGFSLAEIGENLPALWSSDNPDQAIAQLLTDKVKAIDLRMEELLGLKKDLLERISQICPLASSRYTCSSSRDALISPSLHALQAAIEPDATAIKNL